jgi:2-dehydropantoate 2-reductase
VNGRLCELVQQAERSDVRPSWAGEALLAEMRAAAAGTSARDQSMPE